jgi:DNA-binding CsgD family transcriptional regulator
MRHADSAEKAIRSIRKKLKELPENVMNWERFEEEFRAVHPEFVRKLKEEYPTLTSTEVKVSCLLRIGMISREIATLLFLSERTVEVHRLNIRKKLGLGGKQSVQEVLTGVG